MMLRKHSNAVKSVGEKTYLKLNFFDKAKISQMGFPLSQR